MVTSCATVFFYALATMIVVVHINNKITQLNEQVRTQVLTPQCPHLFNTTTYETTHLLLHVLIYLQFWSGRLCNHTRYPGATKTYLNVRVSIPILLNPAVHVLSSSSSTGHIDFKIANITFCTLHSSQPVYLHSSLHACHSIHSIRLSNTNLLSAPFVCNSLGTCSFSTAAPKIWNSLPPPPHTCTSPDTFYSHLKTHYCQQAFQST